MHRSQYVLFRRLAHRILLIIRQDNHVLSGVSEVAIEVCRHVLHVVDAASQLPPLTKVVDTDQQSLPSAITL